MFVFIITAAVMVAFVCAAVAFAIRETHQSRLAELALAQADSDHVDEGDAVGEAA